MEFLMINCPHCNKTITFNITFSKDGLNCFDLIKEYTLKAGDKNETNYN
jgi:hypothetical protein